MGKGDKRTKRGKIYRGSHGRTRKAKVPPKEKGKEQPPARRPASES